jgi:competence CoiA-like predicted nuclease
MQFVNAELKRKHFRHVVASHCEPEPETEEHLLLKEWVHDWLTASGYKCEYEVKIGNRITDVTFSTNAKLRAVECQVSPISSNEVYTRMYDLALNGVSDVYWIMHPLNFMGLYEQYRRYTAYRLTEVETEFLDSPIFLYFDSIEKQVKKYFFKAKWMRGGGGTCSSIFLKFDEKVIQGKYLPNQAIIENWIEGRKREFKEKRGGE